MEINKLNILNLAKISKQAILLGLSERAEQLTNQLETTLQQIDEINSEINTINELLIKSTNDLETQDSLHTNPPILTIDLEPANHPEEE